MSTTTITRTTCKYPGCGQSAAPAAGTGRPPEYCAGRGHTRVSAWRERRRLTAERAGTTISPAEDGTPLTTARMTGAELLRSLRAEADRITALGAGLRDQIGTLTDPTAAEAEVETVRAVAGQRAATAEARAAAAEQQAATADQLRAEADAVVEEMSEHLTAAQTLAQAAELQRDEAVRQARAEADERVAAATAQRDAAIAQARADAEQRIYGADAEREKALHAAADAEAEARQAQQESAVARAASRAAQDETERVRADAEKMLDQVRAEAARERDELRADLRARAERAEQQSDAYCDELRQLRAPSSADGTGSGPAPAKTARRAARTPAT